jgi:hypothetical protein
MQMASPVGTHVFKFKTNLILNILLGNDADGLRLSRKRTIYMLKMDAKVSNRSFGRKDANFRGFYQSADNQHVAKIKGRTALFC